jgi:hypothetical protein
MSLLKKIFYWFKNLKKRRDLEKKLKELRKRDPFIYK